MVTIEGVNVPELRNGNVISECPVCGVPTTFEMRNASREFGTVLKTELHYFEGNEYNQMEFTLMRCAGCAEGGLAKIHSHSTRNISKKLETFYPFSVSSEKLPFPIPEGILKEFREAELCLSFGAYRAASGLFRSVLEKLLKENGYTKGNNLAAKIDSAASDGVITEARRKKAHDEIRVLGNDVLHDEWREVTEEEVLLSRHYAQRIIEDLYDDRESVEEILLAKNKITKVAA